jgi:hypothetical protein
VPAKLPVEARQTVTGLTVQIGQTVSAGTVICQLKD